MLFFAPAMTGLRENVSWNILHPPATFQMKAGQHDLLLTAYDSEQVLCWEKAEGWCCVIILFIYFQE